MDWNIAGAASDILGGLFQTGYNLYTNKRDFDYQKALQQQIFEREDNAVQRRMQDLQAAGINPNLAAGSAAGAGTVVSRSNTNDINIGSALDTVAAVNQIKLQRQQTENAKEEYKILEQEFAKKYNDNLYSKAELYKMLGIPFGFMQSDVGDGSSGIHFVLDSKNDNRLFRNTPLEQLIDYQMMNNKNTADMLQKQNNWYTANQILNSVSSVIGDIADIGGLFKPKFYKGKFVK